MRAADKPASLIDILVALAFAPWILSGYLWELSRETLARRKAVKVKPKRKPKRLPPKGKRIATAAQHRQIHGVAPALRIINGGKA